MSISTPLKIVFMGTPAFAVPSLKALMDAGFNVAAVITAPDKPSGRGMKLQQSDVKKFALEHSIRVLQPVNLKSPDFVEELKSIDPDLQVVVAFRMLPEIVWSLPPLGTINLHASLLPQYRGAAPVNHAIINGETVTGVTTFRLKHDIDTGNILMQEKVLITDDDNAGTLHDKLMTAGAALLVQTVRNIQEGTIEEIQQDIILEEEILKPAPKIFRENCEINWQDTTKNIFNLIRGLSPIPGAFTYLKEKRIIITEAAKDEEFPSVSTGQYRTDGKTFLKFATNDGYIRLLRLKPEGKGEMGVQDFLRGRRDL